jgi:hypothetical protein
MKYGDGVSMAYQRNGVMGGYNGVISIEMAGYERKPKKMKAKQLA